MTQALRGHHPPIPVASVDTATSLTTHQPLPLILYQRGQAYPRATPTKLTALGGSMCAPKMEQATGAALTTMVLSR